jgi:hypothetical protein
MSTKIRPPPIITKTLVIQETQEDLEKKEEKPWWEGKTSGPQYLHKL